MANNTKQHLLTYADITKEEDFPFFKNDRERIKYMNQAYRNITLGKSFSIFYGVEIAPDVKTNKSINNVTTISIGQVVSGTVKEIDKTHILFEIPGIKEEIICKENFSTCLDNIQNYLLNHNNKLIFEVREKKNNKYIVSVINAYYKAWVDNINKAIQHEDGIEVHIDKNVEGGFVCHTPIVTLNNLTGKNYTHLVFIPGSHIVLNIEHNFEQWIDKDVIIVPQKFVEFHRNYKTGEVENSLVGSRKRVLQILGMNNLYEMYQKYLLSKNDNVIYTPEVYEGTITGIINSQKNTGVFVELDGKYITGLMHIDASDLLDYRAGNKIKVKIKEFEVQEGKEAFITNKRGNILKCNTRPVFELA